MSLVDNVVNYDPIASAYSSSVSEAESIILVLEQLMLQHLCKGAHILDIGCAHRHIVKQLHIRGYQTTGIDISEELLRIARANAPESKFIFGDIRELELQPIYNAVISRDVFCHLLNLEELTTVFQKVYGAMHDNGLFVFTTPGADFTWRETLCKGVPDFETVSVNGCDVSGRYVFIEKHYNYNREERIREVKYTSVELINEVWKRSDTTMLAKDYFVSEIKSALVNAGFIEINEYDSRDFGDNTPISFPCFVCRKPSLT
ncbi:class I SAM-dependent methyltransferase [Scytonema sp. NUACC26]|uniref:class I SAM-dependent methyltransferase n=1 Tax=Scytonema sp. NUACC26 TaxID=3140176 RepID=UPI0034DC823E